MTRAHFHTLTIRDIRQETPDTISVCFEIPDELAEDYRYLPGQHLSLKTEIDGEELRRSYSICSSVSDGEMRVAIKRHPHGVFSNHANDHFRPGDRIEVMPPQGRFTLEANTDNRKHYLLFAAGSGITPIIAILKTILEHEPDSRVTLVYGNRDVKHIIFRHRLHALKNAHVDRFNLIHVLSRESRGSDFQNGHIDADKLATLNEKIVPLANIDDVYICGPQLMIKDLRDALTKQYGLEKSQIHLELFGVSQAAAAEREQVDPSTLADQARITVIVDGKESRVTMTDASESILDAALNAGSDLPFACKGGVCATCRAKVIHGEVRMDTNYALDEDEVDQGYVLTCQAHPVSDEVTVDYDHI